MRGRYITMTLITTSRDEGSAGNTLDVALAHYDDVLQAIDIVKLYLKERTDIAPSEIQKTAAEFRRATQTLFDERKKLEDQKRKDAGIVLDFGFDFDVARAEIGGRLDRLRAARHSGDLPE
jgi:hypothetical protein